MRGRVSESRSPAVKVVLHFANRKLVKGFLLDGDGGVPTAVDAGPPQATLLPETLEILSTEGQAITVNVSDCKAVFFVKEFDAHDNTDLRFFRETNTLSGIWVRIRFVDGEVSEGLVPNSLAFVVDPAFYLKPADLFSNNVMIYVLKKALLSLEVLGVR